MSIRDEDKMTVCRHCRRSDFDVIEHGRWVAAGFEDADVVCLWPCGHEVRVGDFCDEPRCLYCQPPQPDEWWGFTPMAEAFPWAVRSTS